MRLAPNTVSTLVGRLAEQDPLRRERSLPDSRSVLLIGVPANLALDATVLVASAIAGMIVASALLPRLAR